MLYAKNKKMLDYNLFKPIRNFALLILAFGVAGILCLAVFHNDPDIFFDFDFEIFILVVSVFHLFMGYNIISRNRFGFKSLKIYLYLIYPGFPLGYYFAKKTFEYINTNGIEKFYSESLKL
jgi:hypothetical protein